MDDSLLARITMALPSLRPAEARLARCVLEAPARAIDETAAQLASRAEVSPATVVRFTRSLGLEGLGPFRTALTQDLSRRQVERERSSVAEGTINPDDDLAQMISKIAFHEARTIENVARAVDQGILDEAARAISRASRTVLLGVGASGLVAADLSQKLERIGLVCQFNPDTHVQLVHAAVCDANSVAIGISFQGNTREVSEGIDVAAGRGATTIALTGDPDSTIGVAADLVLFTPARETPLRAAAMSSRMSQLATVDFLFARVAQLCLDDLEPLLVHTRSAVREHHS